MRKCYTIMALIAVLALGLFAASALAAGSAKPPAPPGQGECAHGNSGKPCKDDPQPEKGKDCEEHGPKNGGVNEDHCKGTTPPPPPTTTTDTTTEETTTSTSTSPTETQTTSSEETQPTSSPPESTSSAQETESSEPGVSKPTLEEQLEKQSAANGASAPGSPAPAAAAPGELPYTGFETWMAVVIGLGLSGAGLALRRWSTK